MQSVEYLGHVVSSACVRMDPEKIKAMVDWPLSQNLTELRGFLGLIGYYRKFVHSYMAIVAPHTNLLKKDSFTRSSKAQMGFKELNLAMASALVLILPNFEEDFVLEIDALDVGIGAVLLQKEHLISYFSKKLSFRMQIASTYV